MNTNKMNFITGMLVFIALILFFSSIMWLSGTRLFFSGDYSVFVDFDDVVGIQDQAPVFMRGYRIGDARDIDFLENRVRMSLRIKKEFSIPEDSSVEIRTLNIMGEKAVTILPGSASSSLAAGAVIHGENRDLMTIAQRILQDIRNKIDKQDLEDMIAKIDQSVDNFFSLLQKTGDKIESLDVMAVNRRIEELGNTGKSLQSFLDTAERETRRFSGQTGESLEKFNAALERVDETLERLSNLSAEIEGVIQSLNRGEGSAGQLLNNREYMVTLNETVLQLKALLEDVKKNPKKYVRFSLF